MPDAYSLLEINTLIKSHLKRTFDIPCWVHAEINELHENTNGMCYLELVQKGDGELIVAKQKALIWSSTYRMMKPYFESATGTPLQSGIKIAAQCTIEFHEVYGMSLTISDIDPNYTLGDMALQKARIIRQLTEEGIINMNKELPLPAVPQRVAVISSATAAGYGDFTNQLAKNKYGYAIYTKLFPSVMQGVQIEKSIIAALDNVYEHAEAFDVVVLIRGGGATSDLSGFDNYNLAAHIAQFPIPIICGIGHQRDNTVIDIVSNTQVNTPTAAADFLLERIHRFDSDINQLAQEILYATATRLNFERQALATRTINATEAMRLNISTAKQTIHHQANKIKNTTALLLQNKMHTLLSSENSVKWNEPDTILKKGYTLTVKNGLIVKSAAQLQKGDMIKTIFHDGEKESKIH